MAKTKKPDPNDPAEVVRQVNMLIGDMSDTIRPALKAFAEFQEHRASRLRDGLANLEDSVGKDHEDYLAVKDALDRSVRLCSHLKRDVSRLENWPKPQSFELLVYGQVLDVNGDPVEGMRVRAFDRDRKYDDLLGETETDSNGDFAIVYHERDFAEAGENLPELYVMVSDQNGEILYSSRDQIRFEAGKSEYFLIQISEPRRKTKKKAKTSRK
jgi:hypothetical protein